MKILRLAIIIAAVFALSPSTFGSNAQSELRDALQGLDEGIKQLENRAPNARSSIATAAAKLEQAVQTPTNQTPSVYHALGNAYFLIEEYGPATLAYRRGHQIDPRDQRLIDSLDLVRSQVETQVDTSIPNRIRAALVSWRGFVPRSTMWWAFYGLFTFGWAVLVARVVLPNANLPRMLGIWIIAGSVLPLATLAYEWSYEHAQVGIVITADATRAMSGPDDSIYDAVYNEPLSGGVEGILEESRDGWARIRLLDGTECWVPEESYSVIQR